MIDVKFTLKSGVQMTGNFSNAKTLCDISLYDDWITSDGEFVIRIKTSEIVAMETVGSYSR